MENKEPPLHIQVQNDNIFCARNLNCDFTSQGKELKTLASLFKGHHKSEMTQHSINATNNITTYIELSRVEIYNFLALTFAFIALTAFGFIIAGHVMPAVAWDSNEPNNPLNTTLRMVRSHQLIVKSLSLVSDMEEVQTNPYFQESAALNYLNMTSMDQLHQQLRTIQ